MNAADRRRLTPALGGIAAALVLLLIALWAGIGRGAHWHDPDAPPKLPPLESTTPPPSVPPLAQYSEVWQRPLFSPARTPEMEEGKGETSGDLQLTGVILLPGLKMAILHDKATNKDYRVVAGSPSTDGPVLLELHPRSAVVESSGARLQLGLLPSPSQEADSATTSTAQPELEQSAGPDASVIVSRLETGNSIRALMAGLSPRERQAAARMLSGLSPQEQQEAIQAFSGLSPNQREQAVRSLMSGSLSTAARARILNTLIEERRRAQQNQGNDG